MFNRIDMWWHALRDEAKASKSSKTSKATGHSFERLVEMWTALEMTGSSNGSPSGKMN